MMMRALLVIALLSAAPAIAAEPSGCDKFKWPVDADRAALSATDRGTLASGATLLLEKAVTLQLKPLSEAKLPGPPERVPAEGTFAGFVQTGLPGAGAVVVSLSDAVWVDVVQAGLTLKPIAFSGATDCDGIRKTLRFEVGAEPLTIQISGSKTDRVNLLIHPGG